MHWYVRYGPGEVPPGPSDPPSQWRGWIIIAPLKEREALDRALMMMAEGKCAEVGEIIDGKARARYSPQVLDNVREHVRIFRRK